MAVTNATLREVDRLRRQLTVMTDAQTVALTRAWVEAWDVLLPEFETAFTDLLAAPSRTGYVSRALAARNIRLRDALQAMSTYLNVLVPEAENLVSRGISQAVLDAADGHEALVATQLPPGTTGATVGFNRVPEQALVAIVERTTQQIHSDFLPLTRDMERAMKRNLVRGIAVGDNPRRTAAKMMRDTERTFNGGLTRALNISRTETLDAHRAATKASERANRTVLAEWEWHAKMDSRTCPSCLAQHGTRRPLEEDGPDDHQQGRCARVSVTKSWKELGFDIEEPPSQTPNSQDWFNSLTPAAQTEIMGPARLKLLQDGTISWADLSTKRSTAGWRDSYGVTPIKNLTQ